MKLYDLEAFIHNKRPDAGEHRDDVVLNEVKFKMVLDENIIPPLEILEGKADRELIISCQRVIAQKTITRPMIIDDLHESLVKGAGDDVADVDSAKNEIDGTGNVEYEDQGTLPEGAFMFRHHSAFLHVDKRGRVQQVDLVRVRQDIPRNAAPVNSEFKHMLVQGVKEHGWDELAALFLKHA